MPVTRGGLQPATIESVEGTQITVNCMFNPSEYSINKTNSYSAGNKTGHTTPDKKFEQGAPKTLTLKLWFDTYQDGPNAEPVTKYTDQLLKLMEVDESLKAPPVVKFEWGGVSFRSVITSLKLNFVLFAANGDPLRATADISLEEKPGGTAASSSTPTASWMNNIVKMTIDQSLSGIAAKFTGSPANWKAIAEANNIEDPLNIPNGIPIKVPEIPPAAPNASSSSANSSSSASSAAPTSYNAPNRP